MDPHSFKISTGEWVHLECLSVMKCHNPTADSVPLQWEQSEIKSGGLKMKLEIPFFLLPPHSSPTPPPPPMHKRRPLFFKTLATFWSVWMELTDNLHLYPPRNSFWTPRMQSSMVSTTKTT